MDMPIRILDGDALLYSQKAQNVEEKYRGYYPFIVSLAQANGCFECDPAQIRAKWSYYFPSTTLEQVVDMFDQYENAGMLERYEHQGKIYAMPVGIDKKGRLPAPSQMERYNEDRLPPLPPGRIQNLPIDSLIDEKTRDAFGVAEERKTYMKDLKAAVRRIGYDEVLAAYDVWVSANPGFTARRPVSTFLRGLATGVSISQVTSPNLQKTEDAIALASDNKVFFHANQKMALAGLVKEFGSPEVISCFAEFFGNVEERSIPFAAKDFLEQASTRLRTRTAKKLHAERAKVEADILLKRTVEAAQTQLAAETEPEIEDNLG